MKKELYAQEQNTVQKDKTTQSSMKAVMESHEKEGFVMLDEDGEVIEATRMCSPGE